MHYGWHVCENRKGTDYRHALDSYSNIENVQHDLSF